MATQISSDLPLTEDEINALVDNQGTSQQLAELRKRVAADPVAMAKFQQWSTQRKALKQLYVNLLDSDIPAGQLQTSLTATRSRNNMLHWNHWGGMAAAVLMTFGAGWMSGHQFPIPPMGQQLEASHTSQDFVRQASYAHAVYTPEVKHPVEVAATEQAHLIQWLSKRLGKPLKVPTLSPQGYELVGGRLLPGADGARAQFMFQNPSGQRITLYLGAMNPASNTLRAEETAFQFSDEQAVPSFYWVDKGFGYALSGDMPRNNLMQLATAVYQQLQ
jgi:anti-sigma factor RsiW